MNVNIKKLQDFANRLTAGHKEKLFSISTRTRREPCYITLQPISEERIETVELPDGTQANVKRVLQSSQKEELVDLIDQSTGLPMMIEIQSIVVQVGKISVEIDELAGSGSPHKRVAKTDSELVEAVKAALGHAAFDSVQASMLEGQQDIDADKREILLRCAELNGKLNFDDCQKLRDAHNIYLRNKQQ